MSLNLLGVMRQEGQSRPVRPVVDAQVMELRARWVAWLDGGDQLQPGDLVVEKSGLGMLKAEARKDVVMILWRFLDLDDWQDREIVNDFIGSHVINRIDCMVAYISSEDASVLVFQPHELARLRKRTPEDDAAAGATS